MSDDSNVCDRPSLLRRPMPVWLAATILGALLGGGVTFQVMRAVGYELSDPNKSNSPMAGGPNMMPGMGGGGGMMGMMGGGMMGGGGAREKRSLTALVGKLELLSAGLQFELNPEQAQTIAAKLIELEQAEKMTNDEAKAHLDAIEELLTEEQKATLAAIELPRGGSSGGRGMGGGMMGGAGGPPTGAAAMSPGGGGPPPGMMGGGMVGGGGPPPDENPFEQEANQKRLRDLLDRLRPSSAETPGESEQPKTADVPLATDAPETTVEAESSQP
jgi:hypothetical protein